MNTSAGNVVEIEAVRLADQRDLVADFSLAHPEAGTSEPAYAIRFQGWAVGRDAPVRTVTVNDGQGKHIDLPLTHRRDDIAELMPDVPWAGRCGFTARIGAVHLPQKFQLELTARLEDGTRALLGFVRGRRRALPTIETRFQPVALTTIGRSGSTWLTWLLGQHPEVLAYKTFDLEPKVMAYFGELIRVLSQPTSYYSALQGDIDNSAEWWAGFEPRRGQQWYECGDEDTERWLGTEYVESLLPFFGARMDALVERLAHADGKPGAHQFVEKMPPTFFGQQLWSELIPGMREIFLVRDPRDVACSIFAFQRTQDRDWFWRSRARTEEDVIREPLGDDVGLLTHCWQQRCARAHLVRYEDLIESPRDTLTAAFEYLGVDASPATMDDVLARGSSLDEQQRDRHVTSTAPVQSVGRWRNDLSPALHDVCAETFAPAMKAFGYT